MLSSLIPHRGSNIWKHVFAGFKPWDAPPPPPPKPRVACCLLARDPHGLNFSVLFSVSYLFSFSLCCFSPSFLFYSHFAFAPRAWNQSQWEPGVYGFPAGVRGSDPLWVSHVGLVKPKRTHTPTTARTLTLFHRRGASESWCHFVTSYQPSNTSIMRAWWS